jgi:hypothetical protein
MQDSGVRSLHISVHKFNSVSIYLFGYNAYHFFSLELNR